MTALVTVLIIYAILTVAYFVYQKRLDKSYDVNATVSKVLRVDNLHTLFKDVSTAPQKVWRLANLLLSRVRGANLYFLVSSMISKISRWSEEDLLRAWSAIAAILLILLSVTLIVSLLQNLPVVKKTDTTINDKPPIQIITATSGSESGLYFVTVLPRNTVTPMSTPTLTPVPTLTPTLTPTLAPVLIPTITKTPTRRIIFGQSLLPSKYIVVVTPTPTLFLSEREKNGLPSIVVLGVMLSEDGFRPKLLLANFGYTISLAGWKLYFDQELVCTFGEYIFWPDTVFALDLGRNFEEKTVDDQLIVKCVQINEKVFSRPVVIKLQDNTGTEVDRYVYEKVVKPVELTR